MPKEKTNKVKIRDSEGNRIHSIKREIKKCSKKMNKLLARHKSGMKRFTHDKRGKVIGTDKIQGIIKGSKRHEALQVHISRLKALVRD